MQVKHASLILAVVLALNTFRLDYKRRHGLKAAYDGDERSVTAVDVVLSAVLSIALALTWIVHAFRTPS